MKLLALLALVALAAASSRRHEQLQWYESHMPQREYVTEKVYQPNKEYLYEYNGQLMTGLPGSSEQHSATRVQALVSLIFKSEEEAYLKIKKIRFGYFNDKISSPRSIYTFDLFEQVPVEQELLNKLELPIKFRYESGLISQLHFAESEQPWSANIKRAILNMLQANIEKKHQTVMSEQQRRRFDLEQLSQEFSSENAETIEKLYDFYTVMEKTIEGECETGYTVVSTPSMRGVVQEPENVMNITKTINFDKCQRRPDIKYNYRFQQMCPNCPEQWLGEREQEKMLRSSTILKLNATTSNDRRRILIESAVQESQYTYVPLSEEESIVQTYVNTTIHLIKSTPIESRDVLTHTLPKRSDSDMVYTLDWDIVKERFFMLGEQEFHDKTPYSEIRDKVGFVKSIMQKLVHYMRVSVEEEAPRQFARLVKVLRMLKTQELERLFEQLYKQQPESFTYEESKKIKNLFVDALAVAGTKDCVKLLVHKIEEREIKPIKAAFVLKKLQQTRVISEEMIEKIWTLTSEKYCTESPLTICQSSYLTVGSLLNGFCAPTEDKLAIFYKQERRELCTRETKQKWVEKLFERFEKCESELCRITVLRTFANAGIDMSIYKLETIIKSRQYTQQIRAEAIFALRMLVPQMPRKIEKILMPIFMNKREIGFIRMAAFHKIMQTKPEKFILDQITRTLFSENNRQVASFVYTTLHAYANSTDLCDKKMAKDLQLSLRHARYLPVKSWLTRSKFLRAEYQNKQDHRSMWVQMHSIMANSSIIPRHINADLKLNHGPLFSGMSMSPYLMSFGITQSNLERYIRKLVRSYSHGFQDVKSTLEDIAEGRWSHEETSPRFRKQLDDIYDELSIEDRQMEPTEEEPFALAYMRYMNMDYGFLPLTKEMLPEQLIELLEKEMSVSKLMKNAKKLLERGGEYSMPFDVHTGSILSEISRKIPTTIGMPLQVSTKTPLVAQARGHLTVAYNKNNKYEIKLDNFRPSMVMTAVCKVEMWSPVVNTGLKWIAQTKVYAPITAKLQVITEPQPQVKFVWEPEQKPYELVRVQTRPTTTVLVWPKLLQQWQEPEEKTIVGEQWPRVYNVSTEFGEKAVGVKFGSYVQWHVRPEKHVKGTPAFFLAGPNKYILRVSPGQSMPREIEMILTGKLFETLSKSSLSPQFDRFYEKSDEFLNERSTSSSEESRERQERNEQEFERYYKEYETTEPTMHQIKLIVQGKGQIERKAELTVDCQVERDMNKAAKCQIKIKRTPIPGLERSEWELQSVLEFLYPKAPRTIKEVTPEKKFMLRVKTEWGTEQRQDKYIDLKLVGEQSRMMERLVKYSLYNTHFENKDWEKEERRSLFSPVAQYEQTKKFGMLDQYKIDIDYKKVPVEFKNVTEKIFDFVKYYYYWQTEVNKHPQQHESFKLEQLEEGQIRAKINIDPESRRYVNFTVEVPRERVFIKDVPLWTKVNALNMRRLSSPAKNYYSMFVDMVSDYELAQCQIRTDRVKTFDEVVYRAPITTCYSVIAKDCTQKEQSKFAVLMKRVEESSEKKELKVIAENIELVIKPKKVNSIHDVELEYILDGQRKPISQLRQILKHNHIVLEIVEDESGYCRVVLPEAGVRVYFDGFAANVKVSPFYRNQLCGMCGEFERESYYEQCDIRTAQGECVSARSPRELKKLFDSYLVSNECSYNKNKYESDEHYEWEPLQWENEERYEHIDEERTRLRSKRVNKPVPYTRVIEQGHEVCFSKKPILKCAKYTHPVDYEQKVVKVTYTCIDRNEYEADDYLRRARHGEVIDEVADLPASFAQNEHVPLKCHKTNY
jgi:hypothetical protein